jgi:hypothetical protein
MLACEQLDNFARVLVMSMGLGMKIDCGPFLWDCAQIILSRNQATVISVFFLLISLMRS